MDTEDRTVRCVEIKKVTAIVISFGFINIGIAALSIYAAVVHGDPEIVCRSLSVGVPKLMIPGSEIPLVVPLAGNVAQHVSPGCARWIVGLPAPRRTATLVEQHNPSPAGRVPDERIVSNRQREVDTAPRFGKHRNGEIHVQVLQIEISEANGLIRPEGRRTDNGLSQSHRSPQ